MASDMGPDQSQSASSRNPRNKLEVPGYGLPINHELDPTARFRHGAVDVEFDRMTIREVCMLGLIEALTDKPNWSEKAFDQAILDKWRTEALAIPMISGETWEWCLSELQDKAKDFEATQLTTVLDMGSRCVKTDSFVSNELRNALKSSVKPLLEIVPRDWHPGSNDQVLDLLHPSLYPAIYGKTRILPYDQLQINNCLLPHNESVILRSEESDGPEASADTAAGDDADGGNDDNDNENNHDHNGNDLPEEITPPEFDIDEFDEDIEVQPEELQAHEETDPIRDTMDAQHLADYEMQLALLNAANVRRLGMARAEVSDDPEGSRGPEAPVVPHTGGQFVFDVHDFDSKDRAVDNDECWSHKFQWLSCNVEFTNDTDTSVAITSYINNLHPDEHRPLYHTIESFISLSIPAWNQILVTGQAGRTPIRIKTNEAPTDPTEPPKWANDLHRPNEGTTHIEEDWEDYPSVGVEWKWKRLRKVIHPEPGASPSSSYDEWKAGELTDTSGTTTMFKYNTIKIQDTFQDAGLQVIVKLASIELTPEKPSYASGSWHIEGMLNEHIVATSVYYFDVENITESRIRFRQEAWLDSTEVSYPQDDHAPFCQVFGVDSLREEPMIQEIGSMATYDGRFLAFPNTLQHKIEPFGLVDPTKPGHRRFLVLWLVDPNYRVLSTANVPPQQHEWWVGKAAETVGGRVSREIQMMIEEQMRDGTLTLEEAKAYRLELMAERTMFADTVQAGVRQYDFCEH